MIKKMSEDSFKFYDAVQCIIECEKCGTTIGGYGADEYFVCDEAMNENWHVTKSGKVYCSKCKRKSKTK